MKKYKIYSILIMLTILFSCLFLINKNRQEKIYWEENTCVRGIPDSFLKMTNKILDYKKELNNTDGYLIEEFNLKNTDYKIVQQGCDSFDIKYFIEIEKDYSLEKEHLISSLILLRENLNTLIINDPIRILERRGDIKFNVRIYEDSCGDLCTYIVISEPEALQGKQFVSISVFTDL